MRSRAPKRANFAMDAGGYPLQISNAVGPSRLEVVMRHAEFKGSPRQASGRAGEQGFRAFPEVAKPCSCQENSTKSTAETGAQIRAETPAGDRIPFAGAVVGRNQRIRVARFNSGLGRAAWRWSLRFTRQRADLIPRYARAYMKCVRRSMEVVTSMSTCLKIAVAAALLAGAAAIAVKPPASQWEDDGTEQTNSSPRPLRPSEAGMLKRD
jgi:hypothetical protein